MTDLISIKVNQKKLRFKVDLNDSLSSLRKLVKNQSDCFIDYEGCSIDQTQEELFTIMEVMNDQNQITMLPIPNDDYEGSTISTMDYFSEQSKILNDECLQQQQSQVKMISQEIENFSFNIPIPNKSEPMKGSQKFKSSNAIPIYLYPRFSRKDFTSNELNLMKTIMVIGQTGSGKTTLLDAIVNYIAGVQFSDKFRYKLVDEQNQNNNHQSSTVQVNSYYIKAGKGLNFPILVIDTPGFNDTEGVMRDKQISQDISNFFDKNIQEIHCISLVSIASLARLTVAQKYVYSQVLELFGKDIEENIANLFTFCDGAKPLVREAVEIEKIPTKFCYKFNNSALFQQQNDEDDDCSITKNYWEMGEKSMKKFFDDLERKFKTKSLKQTKEVLKERQKLDHTIKNLRPRIDKSLNKLDSAKNELIFLQRHKLDLDQNKHFEYDFTEEKFNKVPTKTGVHTTTCQVCNKTCHEDCSYSNDSDKRNCISMNEDYCTVCPGKCLWNHHSNVPYVFIYYTHKEKRTNQQLKDKFTSAKSNLNKTDQILIGLAKELNQIQKQIYEDIEQLHLCLIRLSEIALRPNPHTAIDLIDMMIESEQTEKKPGYLNRLNGLQEIKKQYEMLQKIKIGKKEDFLKEYFKDYQSTLDQLLKKKPLECKIF